MEAGLQLPELAREHLGAQPLELYIGPRRLAFPVDVPERTADEWIKGPPENLREKAAAGFAKKHGVDRRRPDAARRLPRRRGAGPADRRRAAGAARRDRDRAPVRQVDGLGRRLSLRAPGSLALREARRPRRSRSRSRASRAAASPTAIVRRIPAAVEIPNAHDVSRRAARRRRRARPRGALRADLRGARRARRRGSDPLGKLDEVVYLVECAARAGRVVRRALPAAAGARDRARRCSRTSATSRSAGTGSRSSRTAATPTSCAPATSSCSAGASRTPSSPSSATSRSGSKSWRSGSSRSPT